MLDGLGPGGRRTARLPEIKPRIFTLSGIGFGVARPPDEVALRCDTIWIDADRSLCTRAWRGLSPMPPSSRAAPSLVLAFDEGDHQKTWAKALDGLDDATGPRRRAPRMPGRWPRSRSTTTVTARPPIAARARPRLDLDRDDDDESTRTNVQLSRKSFAEILVDDEPSTDRRGASAAVVDSEPEDRPPLLVLGGFRGALASFEATRPARAPAPAGRPQRPSGLRFGHADDSTAVALAVRTPVLPAKAPSPPSAVDTSPPPAAAAPEVLWSLVKAAGRTVGEAIISAGGAAPVLAKVIFPPAREASKAAFNMEQDAQIKAKIWGGDATAAEVLERHEVEEAVFHDHERRLAQGLAREDAEGQSTFAIELRDALKLARDQLPSTGERPLRTMEDAYITLLTAIERAVDPSAILAAKGMGPSSWRRLRRRFEERAVADEKLRDALDVRLTAARKAAGGDTGGSSKWWNRREIAPANARCVPPKPRGRSRPPLIARSKSRVASRGLMIASRAAEVVPSWARNEGEATHSTCSTESSPRRREPRPEARRRSSRRSRASSSAPSARSRRTPTRPSPAPRGSTRSSAAFCA